MFNKKESKIPLGPERREAMEKQLYLHPDLRDNYAIEDSTDYAGRSYDFNPGESETDRIFQLLNKKNAVRDREQMRINLLVVVEAFKRGDYAEFDIVTRFEQIFLDMKQMYVDQMSDIPEEFEQPEIDFEKKLLTDLKERKALFSHLDETTNSLNRALDSIASIRNKQVNPPEFLKERQQLLLRRVGAPLHDIAKLLGTLNQIDPDHENVMEYLLEQFGEGELIPGVENWRLEKMDVEFLKHFISSHEDIYRERWFESLAEGFNKPLSGEVFDAVALDRTGSFFHIIDIFGSAVEIIDHGNGKGTFTIDMEDSGDGKGSPFDKRFLELYQRHMQLDGVPDWNKGKAWRPQWGAYVMRSVIATAMHLKQYGVEIEAGLIEKIRSRLISKLDDANVLIIDSKKEEWASKLDDVEQAKQLVEQIPGIKPQDTGEFYEEFAAVMGEKDFLHAVADAVHRSHQSRTERISIDAVLERRNRKVEKIGDEDPDKANFVWYVRNMTAFLTVLQLAAQQNIETPEKTDFREFLTSLTQADESLSEMEEIGCRTIHGLWYATQLFRGTEDRGNIFDRLTFSQQKIDSAILRGVAQYMLDTLEGPITLTTITRLYKDPTNFPWMVDCAEASDAAYKADQKLKKIEANFPITLEDAWMDDLLFSPEGKARLKLRPNIGLTQDNPDVKYLMNGTGFSTLQEVTALIVKKTGMHPRDVLIQIRDNTLDGEWKKTVITMQMTQYLLAKAFAGEAQYVKFDSLFDPTCEQAEQDFSPVSLAAGMVLDRLDGKRFNN